MRRAV